MASIQLNEINSLLNDSQINNILIEWKVFAKKGFWGEKIFKVFKYFLKRDEEVTKNEQVTQNSHTEEFW